MDRLASIQELKQRLAEATTEVARLAALLEFRPRTAELQRDEAEGYLREVVELARKTRSYGELAEAGVTLSELCRDAGDLQASIEWAGVVQEAARASGDPLHEGQYLFLVGRVHDVRGECTSARDCYERSLRVWRKDGYPRGVGAALNQIGNLAFLQGQATEALQHFRDCLKIDEELGDVVNGAIHQHNIGCTLQQLGHFADAFEAFYRVYATVEQHHQVLRLRGSLLSSLGELFLDRDKTAKAISLFRMAIAAAERNEARPGVLREATANLGLAYQRQGNRASAQQAYGQALKMADKSGDRRLTVVVLWRMAELALDQGQLDRCRELAQRSLAVAREVGFHCEEAKALRVMALLHAARGEDAQARNCFEQSLALLHDLEESADLARVRFHYGQYLITRGEGGAAVTYLRAASRAFRRLGIVAEGYEVNHLLFRQEMSVDRDMALMQGISGLMSLGDEPQTLLQGAIRMLLEAFGFESAAILVRGKPVLTLGNPSLERLPEPNDGRELLTTDLVLSWPVRCGGSLLGRIHLERAAPVATENNLLVLDAIANLLASPILRLTELDAGVAEERPELAGLRYRGLLGRNQRMLDVLAKVRVVASESVPVLIRGESGTGKELVARALHDSGVRAGRPFVAVNCAGVPENLLDEELFGVEQGTTNGTARYNGKLETADGGTMFIDEIGDLSPTLQVKLLRVLQERTLVRVGGTAPVRVDVRLVAATEKTLGELAGQRKFRDEILDRLNGVELVLPALNERPEDVPDLVRHFVQSSSREFGRHVVDVSPEVMARLTTQRWPGNVRDLKYAIERSILSAGGETVQLGDLPPYLRSQPSASPEPRPSDSRPTHSDRRPPS